MGNVIELGYVITWRYSDGSGSGAVAAFRSKGRADALMELLESQGSPRQYKLEPVPLDTEENGNGGSREGKANG